MVLTLTKSRASNALQGVVVRGRRTDRVLRFLATMLSHRFDDSFGIGLPFVSATFQFLVGNARFRVRR